VTEIVHFIHWTYFYSVQQMGINDRSFIDKLNPTFIALTATAIHYCLLAWNTGEFRSCQHLVQKVEHNVSAIKEGLITWFIMHTKISLVLTMRIFIFLARGPCQKARPYLQHGLLKDPLDWYRPTDGTIS